MATKVHNVRFYKPTPRAVISMSFDETTNRLAIARTGAIVEIWNIINAPFIERIIPSNSLYEKIEGLTWTQSRLFACFQEGFVLEYDLRALTHKQVTSITGGAAHCIDANRNGDQLAVGAEKGYINIFSVENDGLVYLKFLDKQEGHILCLKFDPSGKYISSGSMDTIRIWDVATGHAIHKMTTGRSETNKATAVWTIAVTEDLTIITGDSRGKLTFWDGKIGAQIESYQSHKADILSLCVSKDEKTLYCAGIDANIISYEKIQVKEEKQSWVKSVQRKIHDHDVCALILVGKKLYSAGIDGYLACSYHPPKTLLKYPPIIPNPIEIGQDLRLLLTKDVYSLDIWTLGDKEINFLPDTPKRLVALSKQNKFGSSESFIFAKMSNGGNYVVTSTDLSLKIYYFNVRRLLQKHGLSLRAVHYPAECGVCVNATFTAETQVVLALRSGGFQVLDFEGSAARLRQEINTENVLEDTVTILKTSPCKKYFVAADPKSNICIWKRLNANFEFYCKLPKYDRPPTALEINSATNQLVIAYSDCKIVEYDLNKKQFSPFSKHLDQNNIKKLLKNHPVLNIAFDERADSIIILQDDANIVVIDKKLEMPDIKVPRLEVTQEGVSVSGGAVKAIKKYQHLVYLGSIGKQELVGVEVSPLSITEQLPPCLEQNTFGTK